MQNAMNNMIPETIANQYMNGVLFVNDPDTVFLRDYNETMYADENDTTGFSSSVTPISADERESLALWNGMTTNYITTSDRFHRSGDDMLALFRFLQPGEEYLPVEHPDWDKPSDIKTALRKLPNGDFAFLMLNTAREAQKTEVSIKDILPFDTAFVFRWSHNTRLALGKLSTISFVLKPGRVALFYLSQKNQASPRTMSIYGVEMGWK
jgi:hypothetical protein